jgi:hypothetical protein
MPLFLISLLSLALAGSSPAPSSLNPAAPAPAAVTAPEAADPATLVIDAKVPVEVLLGGTTIAELFYPALVQFQVAASGPQVVRLYVSGQPYDVPVQFTPKETARILVGRTGVTLEARGAQVAAPEASGPVALELRFVGGGGATVRLDSQPHKVGPGRGLSTTIPLGRHALSVRSSDGTVIWASGDLFVDGPLVVQITEGRLPEISGAGRFVAGGG